MTNNKVNEMCDQVISVINKYGLAEFISDEKCNALVSEIQALKKKQKRSLASEVSETHEKNMARYVETTNSTPEFSPDFVSLQTDCISILNEIEAALYLQEHVKGV